MCLFTTAVATKKHPQPAGAGEFNSPSGLANPWDGCLGLRYFVLMLGYTEMWRII